MEFSHSTILTTKLNNDKNRRKRVKTERDSVPTSVSEIVGLVNRQKASVVYYSVAVGHLHVWLLVPTRGIVKFHQVRVSDDSDEGERSTLPALGH